MSGENLETHKETAMHVLGLLLGKGLAAAIYNAFSTNTYARLLETLSTLGNNCIRGRHQFAFDMAVDEGRAASVAVLLSSEDVSASRVHEWSHACMDTPTSHTALHYAVELNHPSVVQVLVSSWKGRVCLGVGGDNNLTPLAAAAAHNHIECLQVLLASKDVNVNAVWEPAYDVVAAADDGIMECRTALSEAVVCGSRASVKALLAPTVSTSTRVTFCLMSMPMPKDQALFVMFQPRHSWRPSGHKISTAFVYFSRRRRSTSILHGVAEPLCILRLTMTLRTRMRMRRFAKLYWPLRAST